MKREAEHENSASIDSPEMRDVTEAPEIKVSWLYYDTEVEVDTLLNTCLNPKGIRERGL